MNRICLLSAVAAMIVPVFGATPASAADREAKSIKIGGGVYEMTPPAKWKVVQPKSRIVEHEFAIPAVDGDEQDGRMTIMAAGGSVEANIERWYGQFSTADGGRVKAEKAKQFEIAGSDVHVVDVSGTYTDMPGGPFAGGAAIKRENYRMLAAIIETKDAGKYFLKFYGPTSTVSANEKAFHEMVKSFRAAS